jgi:cystathionine gamma-synthase
MRTPTSHPSAELARCTVAIVAGRGEPLAGAPLNSPPVLASAFRAGGERAYAREGNPTWDAFEDALGALEGGTAVAFSTGMAAAAAVIETLPPTARVVVADTAYAEVRRLLVEREAAGRLSLMHVDGSDTDAVVAAVDGADLAWVDSISNPGLDVAEVDVIARAAHAAEAVLVVDSTLATPINQRPLELGADLVIHSAAKYAGGHSDLLLGVAVAADTPRAARLVDARSMLGAVPGTLEAWLGLRGLRTLALRIEHGAASAAVLAERLAEHPSVTRVRYPGLVSDPSHEVAARVLDGFGAMLSFEVEGGERGADSVCEQVALIVHASSFGGVETLIERHGRWPAGPEVPAGLLRLSVGCEHPDDLWRDLEQALAFAG